MKLSIIIPVGNLDEWRVCESCLKATIFAYKGDAEAELLPCFDLAHKGAYVARNEGLRRATGEWIAWVDCDDQVEVNWFSEIVQAVESHKEVNVIQYDATEISSRGIRQLTYQMRGCISGEDFAHELLRNDGMPAWLWTRVFRREIFADKSFVGRVDEDYHMFLQILPRIKNVWSIGKPLYRYVRHGHGLSNYVQTIDYALAGQQLEELIKALPSEWHWDGWVGLCLTMTDVAIHSHQNNGSRMWVRKYAWRVLLDRKVSIKLKVKCILAAFGFRH